MRGSEADRVAFEVIGKLDKLLAVADDVEFMNTLVETMLVITTLPFEVQGMIVTHPIYDQLENRLDEIIKRAEDESIEAFKNIGEMEIVKQPEGKMKRFLKTFWSYLKNEEPK